MYGKFGEPEGLISPEFEPVLSEWYVNMDHERFRAEVRSLRGTAGGAVISRIMNVGGVVEDAALRYISFPKSSRATGEDRIEYLENTWIPEEYTHGTFDHEYLDIYEDRQQSARDERNALAHNLITRRKQVGDFVVTRLLGRLTPGHIAAFSSVKGLVNEANPEFMYMWIRDFAHEQKLFLLEMCADNASQDEKKHGAHYLMDIRQRLEEHPRLIAATRWLMERHARIVGAEIVHEQEATFLTGLLDPSNDEHVKFVRRHDGRFSKLPGMDGIHPLENSLRFYHPQLPRLAA